MTTPKSIAQQAGALYLLLAIFGAYGVMYVSSATYVRGDAAATAEKILANEFLYRTGIVSGILAPILFLFLSLLLYRLLKGVNEHQAKAMVVLVIVQIPMNFVTVAFELAALLILKGEVLKSFAPDQLNDMTMFCIKMSAYGTVAVEIFWGLWLFPLAQLVYKSAFIPKYFGILLFLAGVGYIVDSLTFILFPAFRSFTSTPALIFSAFGEMSLILWLLIRGVKEIKPGTPA